MKKTGESGLVQVTRALRTANDALAVRVGALSATDIAHREALEQIQDAAPRTLAQARLWAKSANDRLAAYLACKHEAR